MTKQQIDNAATSAGGVGGAAAGTALAGPAGTAVGSAVGSAVAGYIANLFTGKSSWNDAGNGVHQWFTQYGPQVFLDWMRAKHADQFATLEQVKSLYPVFLWETRHGFVPEDQPNFQASNFRDIYKAMGIDYDATVHNIRAIDNKWFWEGVPAALLNQVVVMLPGGGTASVPAVGVAQMQNVANKAQQGAALTPAEKDTHNKMLKAAGEPAIAIGWPTLVILAILIYFLVKR